MQGVAALWLDMLSGILLGYQKTAMAFWKIHVNEHNHCGMYKVYANLYSFHGNNLEVTAKTNWTYHGTFKNIFPQCHSRMFCRATCWNKLQEGELVAFLGAWCVSLICFWIRLCLSWLFLRQHWLSWLTRSATSVNLNHLQFPSLSWLSCLFPFVPAGVCTFTHFYSWKLEKSFHAFLPLIKCDNFFEIWTSCTWVKSCLETHWSCFCVNFHKYIDGPQQDLLNSYVFLFPFVRSLRGLLIVISYLMWWQGYYCCVRGKKSTWAGCRTGLFSVCRIHVSRE